MDESVHEFRRAFWLTLREIDSLRLQQWERLGLTLPQLRVLFQLRRVPGITTGDLAREMGISVTITSGLVIKLEGLGLVERRQHPGDRRREPLHLTPAGADIAGEIAEHSTHIFEAVARQLGDDLPSITAMLTRLGALIAEVRDAETALQPSSTETPPTDGPAETAPEAVGDAR